MFNVTSLYTGIVASASDVHHPEVCADCTDFGTQRVALTIRDTTQEERE